MSFFLQNELALKQYIFQQLFLPPQAQWTLFVFDQRDGTRVGTGQYYSCPPQTFWYQRGSWLLNQTLNLFIVDEDGFSNHYFIPPAESEMDQCRVCEAPAHKHIAENNQKVLDQLEQ